MRPDWPSERELERARPRRAHPWMWLLGLVVLLAGAWLAGLIPAAPRWRDRGLTLLGLGGARFQVSVGSRPPRAWIAADGRVWARRPPASLELLAGEHQIALSFPDLGSAAFTVRGARGDRQTLTGALWGSLAIRGADANVPIAVDLDGDRVGFAPITIDSVSPGAHEVRFSGPGLTPWGQALRVRVGEVTEMIARPMSTPAN